MWTTNVNCLQSAFYNTDIEILTQKITSFYVFMNLSKTVCEIVH